MGNFFSSTAIHIVITIGITLFAAKLLRITATTTGWQRTVFRKFFLNISQGVIYLFGLVVCIHQLPQLSAIFKTLLAGSGILALVVGFATQESLANIISGIFLSVSHPFDVGDRIKLVSHDIIGIVEDITLRHTVLKTPTDTRLIIPNSIINSTIIENTHFIQDSIAKNFIDVQVSYESDLDKTIEIIQNVIFSHELYLNINDCEKAAEAIHVFVRELGSNGISVRAAVTTKTVDENFIACSDIRKTLLTQFKENQIEIPYQKIIVYH